MLDIGSNNGYFTRKFKSAGARYVTGIEPTFIYSMQFIAQHRWQPMTGIRTLPMTLDTIHCLAPVDIIACMGVLYYCPNPTASVVPRSVARSLVRSFVGSVVTPTIVVKGGRIPRTPSKHMTTDKSRRRESLPAQSKGILNEVPDGELSITDNVVHVSNLTRAFTGPCRTRGRSQSSRRREKERSEPHPG